MNKSLVTLTAFFAFAAPLSLLSVVTTQTAAAAATKVAPADEYFGPLEMSILGIRNSIKDAANRLDQDPNSNVEDALKHAVTVEESVRDWEAKYPADNWLPRTILSLHRLYSRIPTEEASRHAAETASWLTTRYAYSDEAQAVQRELAAR